MVVASNMLSGKCCMVTKGPVKSKLRQVAECIATQNWSHPDGNKHMNFLRLGINILLMSHLYFFQVQNAALADMKDD